MVSMLQLPCEIFCFCILKECALGTTHAVCRFFPPKELVAGFNEKDPSPFSKTWKHSESVE
jgi:hypothetical protein